MAEIETFVIIDLETTGLPHLEYNRTKITEMCLLAASRKDIRNTAFDELPPMCKLSFILNPEKSITTDSALLTGITDDLVKNSSTFKEKFNTLNAFLQDLKKPVCLVAHNGYNFDYRILLAECIDADVYLPDDLLCIDSLGVFRKLPRDSMTQPEKPISSVIQLEKSIDSVDECKSMNSDRSMNSTMLSDIMTDDEDDWPELNVTREELKEIDELCSSFIDLSQSEIKLKPKKYKKSTKASALSDEKKRLSFKLTDIYTRYFGGTDDRTAHRAEDDCLMLLQCMVAEQKAFLKFSDNNCKLLIDCKPLERKRM